MTAAILSLLDIEKTKIGWRTLDMMCLTKSILPFPGPGSNVNSHSVINIK